MKYARWPVLGLPGCLVILNLRGEWRCAIDDQGGDWSQWTERQHGGPTVRPASDEQLNLTPRKAATK